ncbi:MAG: hypothetical protein P0Y65_10180 [Candidatus Devosia phytovorans]|uniref:DUF5666 domain-containing protein n=1 Tax=Candidatus Devosia phytovorans TaxID=3121372 RepID=A0AAJ5VZ69_9HYPH|nr:hypothetical protein [Devosia sp.]WEK06585.1 MAG: hypothetical protein P0Y65_10180 [Devosia sp.]
MNFATLGLAATIALGTTGFAFAQQAARLDDLDADRLNATQVIIEFEYDGSACEAVGTAEVGDLVDGTLAVTFPTTSTAEVCTRQLVEIEVEQAIVVPEGATQVEVTLLAPDGSVKATGTDRIDHD